MAFLSTLSIRRRWQGSDSSVAGQQERRQAKLIGAEDVGVNGGKSLDNLRPRVAERVVSTDGDDSVPGCGEREKFGLVINDLVARGEVSAPIVIGRDHLDCGSVASPNRETEGMKDGSDAVADWPLLNALANCASGADWVSLHNGGGVGIGNSTHSGMVIVATGTPEKAERLKRVLTTDPGMGVIRHVDAGYEEAIEFAEKNDVKIPMRK